jgi:hypothetical protein
VNRSYPEGNWLLLCISTGRATLADSIKPFVTALRKPSKDGRSELTVKLSQCEVGRVIRRKGRPGRRPDPKKPTKRPVNKTTISP